MKVIKIWMKISKSTEIIEIFKIRRRKFDFVIEIENPL